MIRTKESIAVFSLVVVFACLSLAGTEPNDPNAALTFVVSSTELPAPRLNTVYPHPGVPDWKGTVTYAAGLVRNDSPHFANNLPSFIEYARSWGISEQQRRFLAKTYGGLVNNPSYTPPEDPNSPQFLLYAVSLDDAKKMALAYVRYARGEFRHRAAPRQAEVKKFLQRQAEDQQKLPEATQSAEVAKKAFEDLQKQVPYREDKQSLDAAGELDRMLNMAQVDIAGIRARIEAIQSEQAKAPSTAVATQLEIMFIQEAVALRGTQARKDMATTLRKQADSYIDLKAAWQNAELEKDRLSHDVSILPEVIRKAQENLAAEMQKEPKIIDNRVFIYLVRQDNPPSPAPRPQTSGSNQP